MDITAVMELLRKGRIELMAKTFNIATGLVNYDLERPALALYPWGQEITPLYYDIPIVKSNSGDTATRWKAITGINTAKMPMGLSEGHRSGIIQTTLANYTAAYVGLGVDDATTFEAQYASEGFDDARARMIEGLLRAFIIGKEAVLLGGNSSVALGTPTTPTAGAAVTTGGVFSNGTVYVGVVALTADGLSRATVSAAGVIQQIVRSNADASSDTINGGTSQPSAVGSWSLAGGTSTQTINASCPAVLGAVGYAWYISTTSNVTLYLQQITTINSVSQAAALLNTTQLLNSLTATDFSTESTYSFDGLLYLTGFKAGNNAYLKTMATGVNGTGTPLTADGSGGIVEINTMLKDRWDNYRLTPETLWLNSQEAINITNKVIGGGSAPLYRYVMDADRVNSGVVAGAYVGTIVDKVRGKQVKLRVHPNMPAGCIFADSKTIPYPLSGVAEVRRVKARRTVYQTDWPVVTRQYSAGVYDDSVLQHYFPPSAGIICNIGNA